ncbi:MAG: MmcB family DNA repair protein [Lachnospiraceae bacterium]|nr:MmcB family DNA repair protein [Lachnospiraceae bacterium]
MKEAKKLSDKDMREILFDYYEMTNERLRFFEELCIGKSRADAILVKEDRIIGFEIKSDKDNLLRLETQMKDYTRFCDECYIVTGDKHVNELPEVIPDFYGIIKIYRDDSDELAIEVVREATKDPKESKRRKIKHQMALLWRSEITRIAKANNVKPISKKSKPKIAMMLADAMEYDELRRAICDELIERDYSIYNEKQDAE